METEAYLQQVIAGTTLEEAKISQQEAPMLAECLKAEADRHWRIDPHISLRCADEIIRIGKSVEDPRMIALGTMSRGDTLRYLHRNDEAWQTLHEAGELYRAAGDEVGWARTRIGRLAICVEMNAVESGLEDAEKACAIFKAHNEIEKLIRLESNTVFVLNDLTRFPAAIDKCKEVFRLIDSLPSLDDNVRIVLHINRGEANQGLGNLQAALSDYVRARELMVPRGEDLGIALADLFIINIAQAQGHTKKALQLLHETIEVLARYQDDLPIREMWHLIECYLFLNRFTQARDLAQRVIQQYPPDHETHDLALALLQLTMAQTALGELSDVFPLLERAEKIFQRLNAVGWLGTAYFQRGRAALRCQNLETARQASTQAAEQFRRAGQQISSLMALLLTTQVDLAARQVESALQTAINVQKMAREFHIPHLRYEAYLLLGKIAEQKGQPKRAIRKYRQATGIMERIQRSLVLTSRSEFLADKQESVQALVRLNLQVGRTKAAFAALERAKAQVWLGYLSQLDHLRWLQHDEQTQPLIDQLSRLREEHHWFYRAAHDQAFREQHHVTIPAAEAGVEASHRERRLRVLTEKLYLHSSVEDLAAVELVTSSSIQQRLSDSVKLVAYYSDGNRMWAFLLDSQQIDVYPLPETVSVVEELLDKWQTNINRALRTLPESPNEKLLGEYGLALSQRLYNALLRPFAERLNLCTRLIIVPFGVLHYLPFSLLHDGAAYLLERSEVVILPTASLITRQSPCQERKALSISFSWDGRLHYTGDEAQQVINRFGGQSYSEDRAVQSVLRASPAQILHISAHGEYRMDQPEFSYIQLADGPLYTDDLFQHDLRYELVTLSACETGRSRVAAGDELIGLGRGFLFAGAGALIASLWRVDEAFTLALMDTLYQQLNSGASKASALRQAQLALMRAYPGLHPAFWGAFQLIGNADPLTTSD